MENSGRQRFRPERTGVNTPLGALEAAVMRYVWDCGETGVLGADIQQALDKEQAIALTTVLTTLDRLLQKGIVQREREGKAYRYHAAVSEQELERRIVAGVLDNLIARFPKAVATYFAQARSDESRLSDLARRVEEMRRERRQEEETDG